MTLRNTHTFFIPVPYIGKVYFLYRKQEFLKFALFCLVSKALAGRGVALSRVGDRAACVLIPFLAFVPSPVSQGRRQCHLPNLNHDGA
jgi:hypothetical protein